MRKITYKNSGVDIAKAGLFKSQIRTLVRKSFRPEVLKDIGGFGSLFEFPKEKYNEPVLVSSADGVGTKLKIAMLVNKHNTIGVDAVAMNVNDILCIGAEPLFFLDYIAYSKVQQKTLLEVVKGLNRGCIEAGCSLIGGETAQMPGMYSDGEYDLAGFCVGVVRKEKIIDGSGIKEGDVIIGLESSGLHSNGYSLARKAFSQNELKRMSNELLKPTRIYVKPILSLLRTSNFLSRATCGERSRTKSRDEPRTIKGLAHITGGAFYDKIARILPGNVCAKINRNSWAIPKIFRLIQNKGNIEDKEMYHTFNMGIGMVLVTEPKAANIIISKLAGHKLKAWVIGGIVKGRKQVEIVK